MIAVSLGLLLGAIVILGIRLIPFSQKSILYALVLSGIGFLYVGYCWTDVQLLMLTCVQAIFFLMLGYYGIVKNPKFLIAGYFLHGCWDVAYHYFFDATLVPPAYDLFCLTIDFVIGFYLIFSRQQEQKANAADPN